MADDAGAAWWGWEPEAPVALPGMGNRGFFPGGFCSGIRGRDRGPGRGRGARGGKAEDKEWMPVTKLGCLVKDMKIKSLEELYLFSLPIKESEIIDFFLEASLKDEVLKIMPLQKQTRAGQRTKFKVTGRCGSVLVRLIPVPRGVGIVSAPVPKKLFMMAGISDCYTLARGCTATLGNFSKTTFDETVFTKSPYQEFTDHLVKTHTRVSVRRTQAPAVATT
uniref:Small ribosomal subunit protein uS5 n=1 Tax=Callithrix jacchus TaxID=9483 RepID=A0A2R8P2Y7_CALJA